MTRGRKTGGRVAKPAVKNPPITRDSNRHKNKIQGQVLNTLQGVNIASILTNGKTISDIPDKAQICIALSAFGWSQTDIGLHLDIDQSGVNRYLDRWDPGYILRGNPILALAIQSALMQSKAQDMLFSITDEDIDQADMREKAMWFKALNDRSDTLIDKAEAVARGIDNSTIDAALAQMKANTKAIDEGATLSGIVAKAKGETGRGREGKDPCAGVQGKDESEPGPG